MSALLKLSPTLNAELKVAAEEVENDENEGKDEVY